MNNKTNKLRNAFLIAGFCLLNTFSYGQTKEETISWMEEKLTKYIYEPNYNVTVESIDECEITIKTINSGDWNMVPTSGMKITTDGSMCFSFNAIKVEGRIGNFSRSCPNFSIRISEDQILSRIEKAVEHLATFCPKKKETF